MNILEAYKYFFYRTYKWQLSMFGETDNPKYTAILANSACIFFNLLTFVLCFQIITGITFRVENTLAIIIGFILIPVNYFFLIFMTTDLKQLWQNSLPRIRFNGNDEQFGVVYM